MNQRDLELLSSYLDGKLEPSDSARLEARLTSDPSLQSVLDDLSSARGLLRKLPMRKAPRNFTLTPKMVGKNPPLPRSYPAFRFVTALATLLLFFTVGVNFLAPQLASPQAFGMGGGGAPEVLSAQAPAATEGAVPEAATEAPAQAPSAELVPAPTATAAAQDNAREAVTPLAKEGATAAAGGGLEQPPIQTAPPRTQVIPPVPPIWQIIIATVALLSALVMVMMRRLATERWRNKK